MQLNAALDRLSLEVGIAQTNRVEAQPFSFLEFTEYCDPSWLNIGYTTSSKAEGIMPYASPNTHNRKKMNVC